MNETQFFSVSKSGTDLKFKMDVERLDMNIAGNVKVAFASAIAGHSGDVFVDMSSVKFVDSSGIGALVSLKKRLGKDAQIKLLNTDRFVSKVLRLTKLDQIFGT